MKGCMGWTGKRLSFDESLVWLDAIGVYIMKSHYYVAVSAQHGTM